MGRLRADARRSEAALVAAARKAVAEVGLEVSTNEIVKRAGVGPGTFYRRFPSRQALLETILLEVVEELEDKARAALEDPDPGQGFARLLRAFTLSQVENKGLSDALAAQGGSPEADKARERLRDLIRRVTERAQRAGAVRPDLSWADVPFLAAAAAGMTQNCLDLHAGAVQRDRVLAVLLAGTANSGPELPGEPAAL
ncbi:TetR/AcrR family transcriptional regulator [Saccharopolyspora hirsuta]|uniref:TetR/AcrR family transcriptional regulator n=1 Tax=Saccharopolyspora hirsuta TaxID=1837 RepID=A0A5M7C4I6_SACHI|nr:TetR/AcrR family transcriptional regulator [Saccharopolyspora hirsuta]KAA5836360.1 TetR/AcrR family transcriptional regulator [Saccharopolyspora hirsuta]